jgi:hypothetical protein
MSPNPPRFEKPYHLAKWVAGQLHRHHGASARGLYQEYLGAFAEFGMDSGPASSLIQEHLKKLEQDGLVISEKGNGRGGPRHWAWVGPIPSDEPPAVVEKSLTVEPEPADFAAIDHDAPAIPPGMPDPGCVMNASAPQQLPIAGLEHSDEWDPIATSFAQACR